LGLLRICDPYYGCGSLLRLDGITDRPIRFLTHTQCAYSRLVFSGGTRRTLMHELVGVFLFAALTALVSDALAVTMDWSPVGDPGNANDPATGSLYGAVPYAYNIGTKDVTA